MAGAAAPADLEVRIADQQGDAVSDAVVSLTVPQGIRSEIVPVLPIKAMIDQDFETFFPLVTVVPVGGSVTFHNSDRTMHQVYSFSKARQFELEIDVGRTSPPVVFAKVGIAAIGCNIHDQMLTYVVVTDNPYTKLSDTMGAVRFEGLAPGHYEARLWHPDLAPGTGVNSQAIDMGESGGRLSFSIKLLRRRMAHSSHTGGY